MATKTAAPVAYYYVTMNGNQTGVTFRADEYGRGRAYIMRQNAYAGRRGYDRTYRLHPARG